MTKKMAMDELLSRAAQADKLANQTADQFFKTSWLAIAEGYRGLAQLKRSEASAPDRQRPPTDAA